MTLTNEFLLELSSLADSLSFTYSCTFYTCDLATVSHLKIEMAEKWLSRQSIKRNSNNKQLDRYGKLKRWVELSKQYLEVLALFYPIQLTPRPSHAFIQDIISSSYLVTKDIKELKEYWAYKSSCKSLHNLSLLDLIEYGRINKKLGLSYFVDFSEVFDVESKWGYPVEAFDRFNLIFNYLKQAESKGVEWRYTKHEWTILSESLSIWQAWYRLTEYSPQLIKSLLNKYLRITYVHPFFERILFDSSYTLNICSPYYIETEAQLLPETISTIEQAYDYIGVPLDTPIAEIRKKYLEQIKVYHPDKNNSTNTDQAVLLNNAWALIKANYETSY